MKLSHLFVGAPDLSSLLCPSSSSLPKDDSLPSTVKLTVYLQPSLAERVEMLAALKGVSKSSLMASILASALYSDSFSALIEKMRIARQ